LDNSFSSIDNNVAFKIIEQAIIPLKEMNKIIIFATCDKKWLMYADRIYKTEGNTIKEVSSADIDTEFVNYNYDDSKQEQVNQDEQKVGETCDNNIEMNKTVSKQTYLYYFKNTGLVAFILVVIWVALMQFGRNFIEIWLANWVKTSDLSDKEIASLQARNTKLYVIFVICHTIFTILRSERFATVCLKACTKIYEEFIQKLFASQIDFFMNNDVAKLSNILQNDIYEIDEKIPFELNRLLAYTFALIGSVLVLGYSSLYFLLISFFVAVYYISLFKHYTPASRFLSKLSSGVNEPYMGLFLDTIE
jgi:ATP-binding cassette subfamily C (CFTR/MRP) protein 10